MFQAVLKWGQTVDWTRHVLLGFFVTPMLVLIGIATLFSDTLAGSLIKQIAESEFHVVQRSAAMGREVQAVIAYRKCVTPNPSGSGISKPPEPVCGDYAEFEEPLPDLADQVGAKLREGLWAWLLVSPIFYVFWVLMIRPSLNKQRSEVRESLRPLAPMLDVAWLNIKKLLNALFDGFRKR